MKTRSQWLLLLCGALAAPGCYRYTPVATPTRGMEVRAQLETEAAVRRSEGLDEPIVRYDGVVVDVTPDTFAIDVLVARSTSAFQDIEIRDTVRLRTTDVRSLQQRRISPGRTALFSVGAVAAAFAVVSAIDAVVGGTGEDDDDGPPQALRVPLLRWTGARLLPAFLGRREDE
jgi:hypothetical protein